MEIRASDFEKLLMFFQRRIQKSPPCSVGSFQYYSSVEILPVEIKKTETQTSLEIEKIEKLFEQTGKKIILLRQIAEELSQIKKNHFAPK